MCCLARSVHTASRYMWPPRDSSQCTRGPGPRARALADAVRLEEERQAPLVDLELPRWKSGGAGGARVERELKPARVLAGWIGLDPVKALLKSW